MTRSVSSPLAGMAVVLVFVMAVAASSAWTTVPSPNTGDTNFLYSVAAISPANVWAVGYAYNNTVQSTLVEHWNGTSWNTVPSPNPGTQTRCGTGYSGNALSAVAAFSTSDAWTVGWICGYESQTLTEHWNGSRWMVVSSPNEGDAEATQLAAVAGTSSTDVWTVGNYQVRGQYQWNTFIEHWDGTKWSIVASPNVTGADKNFLTGVAAVSPTDVWAVGYSESTASGIDTPLIEHYDGHGWRIVASPYPAPSQYNLLYGVAALASNDVWALGYANESSQGQNGTALIEHWDGTKWNLVDNPVAGYATDLYALAPVSSTDIWAVGYIFTNSFQFEPITEHWNGSGWSVIPPSNPGKFAQLFGATAVNGNVWAVGAYSQTMNYGFMQKPLTLTLRR